MTNERRKFPRIRVSFPVECKLLPAQDYFYTVSKDLSLCGAKIVSNEFIAKNEVVKLSLNLINKILDVKARIVWCSRERAADRYSAGVEFVEVGRSSRDDLSAFLTSTNNS